MSKLVVESPKKQWEHKELGDGGCSVKEIIFGVISGLALYLWYEFDG